jgi:hypothetical protein
MAKKDPLYRPNKSTKPKFKAKKSASHSPYKVTKTKPTKAKTVKSTGPKYTPQPGEIDYSPFSYYQLTAICRERGLIRGGNQNVVLLRLQKDDKLVLEGKQDERERCQYDKGTKPKREYKHAAPQIPSVGTAATAASVSATPADGTPAAATLATPSTPVPPASPKRKRDADDIDGKDDEDVGGSRSDNGGGSGTDERPKKALKKAKVAKASE